jgi:hypothetical protein
LVTDVSKKAVSGNLAKRNVELEDILTLKKNF